MHPAAARSLGVLIATWLVPNAWAQAWLPPKHSFGVGLVHADTLNKDHYTPSGGTVDVGHTRTFVDTLLVSYSPTSRILIAGAIPYVRARYYGSRPHPGSEVDDGDFHSSVTDVHLQVHYQWRVEPFALAPYLEIVIPTTDYPTLGHATAGRGLEEQTLGFFVGKSLDQWLPRTYLQARYAYSFVEKVAGVSHDRSNADLELGYFFNPQWSMRAIASWQNTHGGIDVPVPPSNPYYPYHDQIARERYVRVGAGLAWSLNERSSSYLLYQRSVSGANGHRLNDGFTLGYSYGFTPR